MYATLEPQKNGDLLVVWDQDELDEDTIDYLGTLDDSSFWCEVLEYYLCNGYEAVMPEDIGALTDAFIIGNYGETYWWDADYAVANPWLSMKENKPYRLFKAKSYTTFS